MNLETSDWFVMGPLLGVALFDGNPFTDEIGKGRKSVPGAARSAVRETTAAPRQRPASSVWRGDPPEGHFRPSSLALR